MMHLSFLVKTPSNQLACWYILVAVLVASSGINTEP